MVLFLTSNPFVDKQSRKGDSCHLNSDNGFVRNLRKVWPEQAKVLYIASDPYDFGRNEESKQLFREAPERSGLPVAFVDVCDARNAGQNLAEFDVLILAGGHVPTQNRFFHEIHLEQRLWDYRGIVISISAGSMNSAEVVYAQPELEGEAIAPDYERYLPGLGLTEYQILPHYYAIKDEMLDGMRMIEEITLPDSMGNNFFLLPDGSYILETYESAVLYGEAYLAHDGVLSQVCRNGSHVILR